MRTKLAILALVGTGIITATTAFAATPDDGFVLPFPPTPSASKAGQTLQESVHKRRVEPDRQALGQAARELMERLLVEQVAVTDEDFRQLMTLRTRWVQDRLVRTGQVAGNRLLLVAPKSLDATYRGESRVNLSLN